MELEFKDKLKEYRKEINLSQTDLAKKLGIARSTLSDMENGRIKGKLTVITKLADISGKDIGYWTGDGDINIRKYEALDILIKAMIENGHIKEGGKIPEEYREIVLTVLEKEIDIIMDKIKKE